MNYAEKARAAYAFVNQPYAHHAIARRDAMDRALNRPVMKKARAIVQRLHGDLCVIRPHWGLVPHALDRAEYERRKERAQRRYDRAFNRYHNIMRPAALRRI